MYDHGNEDSFSKYMIGCLVLNLRKLCDNIALLH